MLPDLIVLDDEKVFQGGILDQYGNPILYETPSVEWFGFVPLEEKDD